MPKQRGEKGKSSLPGEEALPACVRPRGVEGRSRGLTCCPRASSPTAPAQEHLPAPLRSEAFTAALCVLWQHKFSERVGFSLKMVQCRPGQAAPKEPQEGAGIWGSSGSSRRPWDGDTLSSVQCHVTGAQRRGGRSFLCPIRRGATFAVHRGTSDRGPMPKLSVGIQQPRCSWGHSKGLAGPPSCCGT